MTLTPATGSATSGSMILDPTDDPYAGAAHRLYVDFLSVGKADCILLRMDDRVILIDTGEKADAALIRRTLDGYGIRRIDCLILTHYDNDHIGAAAAVLEGVCRRRGVYARLRAGFQALPKHDDGDRGGTVCRDRRAPPARDRCRAGYGVRQALDQRDSHGGLRAGQGRGCRRGQRGHR
ncbi:MAG: MBL fold metallo-hydrolase [Oscillospiraceae bacterium]|nr:MAG: MBL fold metallo-hydrolase [Oscillospiraceae bacterium]